MVKNERLIISPIPDWGICIPLELQVKGFCLSYQYDFNESFYGPYGFRTNAASQFLDSIFPVLFFYDAEKNEIVKKRGIGPEGVYFFEDDIQKYTVALTKFNANVKVNEIKKRKGMPLTKRIEEPFFSNIMTGATYNMNKISMLFEEGVGFFIFKKFSPILGDSVILFDYKYLLNIEVIAGKECLSLIKIDSLRELKDW